MIDLDEHNHQSAESGTSVHDRLVVRQKMTLRLVAAFVVGVVLGGFGVSQLRDSRDQRERNAVVAFVAFPQSGDSGSAASEGSVRLSGYLALANAGPGPITVRQVHAKRPGVVIHSIGSPRLLPAGNTGQLAVELWFECSVARLQREPLPLGLSVETDDKQGREVSYPVALVGSDWEREALSKCSGIDTMG